MLRENGRNRKHEGIGAGGRGWAVGDGAARRPSALSPIAYRPKPAASQGACRQGASPCVTVAPHASTDSAVCPGRRDGQRAAHRRAAHAGTDAGSPPAVRSQCLARRPTGRLQRDRAARGQGTRREPLAVRRPLGTRLGAHALDEAESRAALVARRPHAGVPLESRRRRADLPAADGGRRSPAPHARRGCRERVRLVARRPDDRLPASRAEAGSRRRPAARTTMRTWSIGTIVPTGCGS